MQNIVPSSPFLKAYAADNSYLMPRALNTSTSVPCYPPCNRTFKNEKALKLHVKKSAKCAFRRRHALQELGPSQSRSVSPEDDMSYFHNQEPAGTISPVEPQTSEEPPTPERGSKEPDGWPEDEQFPGAGMCFGKVCTRYEQLLANLPDRRNIYYPFSCEEDWEMASVLHDSGMSNREIDTMLKTKYIKARPLSFSSASTLKDRILHLPPVPCWKFCKIQPRSGKPAETPVLFYREPMEIFAYLQGNPRFSEGMEFTPRKVWDNQERSERRYTEISTAKRWWEVQEHYPIGSTTLPFGISSDITNFTTHSGGKKGWPVYVTLGNIASCIRGKSDAKAWVCLAYIPIVRFQNGDKVDGMLQNRLFHQCMRHIFRNVAHAGSHGVMMADSKGNLRHTYPFLHHYMADLVEQQLIACVGRWSSPITIATYKDLDQSRRLPLRTGARTLQTIEELRQGSRSTPGVDPANLQVWLAASRARGLNGVDEPFWKDLPHADPCRFLAPDALHGQHKFVKDHILSYIIHCMTPRELDARLKALQIRVGHRHFANGISRITQWTGRESKEFEKRLVSICVGHPGITSRALRNVRALMDHIYLSALHEHTDSTISELKSSLRKFHNTLNEWAQLGARMPTQHRSSRPADGLKTQSTKAKARKRAKGRSIIQKAAKRKASIRKNGTAGVTTKKADHNSTRAAPLDPPVAHFRLPKLEMLGHFGPSIEQLGALHQFTTDLTEHCHITLAKDGYRNSNHKNYMEQMCRYLDRRERIQAFREFLNWYKETPKSLSSPTSHCRSAVMQPPEVLVQLTKTPHYLKKTLKRVQRVYGLHDLVNQIQLKVKEELSENRNEDASNYPQQPNELPSIYTRVDIWREYRLHLRSVWNVDIPVPASTIQALPPSAKMKHGRCNAVLVIESEDASVYGIQGYRIAQLRMIFRIASDPSAHSSSPGQRVKSLDSSGLQSILPSHLHSSLRDVMPLSAEKNAPSDHNFSRNPSQHIAGTHQAENLSCRGVYAYVQWFSKPKPSGLEKDSNMYLVKRLLDKSGRPQGSVIDIESIARPIDLVPRFRGPIDASWNSDNILDIASEYLVNSFDSHETYQAGL